jgi:hypothetical protein
MTSIKNLKFYFRWYCFMHLLKFCYWLFYILEATIKNLLNRHAIVPWNTTIQNHHTILPYKSTIQEHYTIISLKCLQYNCLMILYVTVDATKPDWCKNNYKTFCWKVTQLYHEIPPYNSTIQFYRTIEQQACE